MGKSSDGGGDEAGAGRETGVHLREGAPGYGSDDSKSGSEVKRWPAPRIAKPSKALVKALKGLKRG